MRKTLTLLCLLACAACVDTPVPAPKEPLQFNGPSYTFNVTNINVVQDYKGSKRPPNVDQLADISPAQAVRQWAGVRLMAAGHHNSLEVDISDASVIRTDIPKQKTGLEGMFTTEQTEQYDGRLEVQLKIYNETSPLAIAHLTATATQRMTLPENATLSDREHLYHQMTLELMKALEPQLDDNIHRYLRNYLL